GQQITPYGLQREAPTSALARLLDQGLEALRSLPGFNFGQPSGEPAVMFPVGTPETAAPNIPVPTPDTPAPQGGQVPQGQQVTQTPVAAVQAIKNQLSQMGASASWTLAQLVSNREQFVRLLGEEGWRELVIWAQSN